MDIVSLKLVKSNQRSENRNGRKIYIISNTCFSQLQSDKLFFSGVTAKVRASTDIKSFLSNRGVYNSVLIFMKEPTYIEAEFAATHFNIIIIRDVAKFESLLAGIFNIYTGDRELVDYSDFTQFVLTVGNTLDPVILKEAENSEKVVISEPLQVENIMPNFVSEPSPPPGLPEGPVVRPAITYHNTLTSDPSLVSEASTSLPQVTTAAISGEDHTNAFIHNYFENDRVVFANKYSDRFQSDFISNIAEHVHKNEGRSNKEWIAIMNEEDGIISDEESSMEESEDEKDGKDGEIKDTLLTGSASSFSKVKWFKYIMHDDSEVAFAALTGHGFIPFHLTTEIEVTSDDDEMGKTIISDKFLGIQTDFFPLTYSACADGGTRYNVFRHHGKINDVLKNHAITMHCERGRNVTIGRRLLLVASNYSDALLEGMVKTISDLFFSKYLHNVENIYVNGIVLVFNELDCKNIHQGHGLLSFLTVNRKRKGYKICVIFGDLLINLRPKPIRHVSTVFYEAFLRSFISKISQYCQHFLHRIMLINHKEGLIYIEAMS